METLPGPAPGIRSRLDKVESLCTKASKECAEQMICDVWFETPNSSWARSYVLLLGNHWIVLNPRGWVTCACLRKSWQVFPASCRPRHWASANLSLRQKPCWQIDLPNSDASKMICLSAKAASPHCTPGLPSQASVSISSCSIRWKRKPAPTFPSVLAQSRLGRASLAPSVEIPGLERRLGWWASRQPI